MKSIGGWAEPVRQKTKPSMSLKNNLGCLISCLQFERLNEVIQVLEEIVVCGTFKWWGTIPCDSLSKPIVAE
jgi:hypothetical protein